MVMMLGQVTNATLKQPDDLSRVRPGRRSHRLRPTLSSRFSASRNGILGGNECESDFLFVFEAHFTDRLKNSILVKGIESFCHGNSRSIGPNRLKKVYKGREPLSNSFDRNANEHGTTMKTRGDVWSRCCN
jgi:hypothetical protein